MAKSRRPLATVGRGSGPVVALLGERRAADPGAGPTQKTQKNKHRQASAAVLTLRKAATAAIGEQDPVVRPGQLPLHPRERVVGKNTIVGGPKTTKTFDYLADNVIEDVGTGGPDRHVGCSGGRSSVNGKWVIGTAAEAGGRRHPPGQTGGPSQLTGPVRQLLSGPGSGRRPAPTCTATGRNPTPAWAGHAARRSARDAGPAEEGLAPRSNRATASVDAGTLHLCRRCAAQRPGAGEDPGRWLYQTLALLPDLKVTEGVAKPRRPDRRGNGRRPAPPKDRHPAPRNPVRQEIIIDPATGQFIGETDRRARGRSPVSRQAPSPTPVSVTTSVVNSIGATRLERRSGKPPHSTDAPVVHTPTRNESHPHSRSNRMETGGIPAPLSCENVAARDVCPQVRSKLRRGPPSRGSREELPLPAPTDPGVKISLHRAPVTVFSRQTAPTANAQNRRGIRTKRPPV